MMIVHAIRADAEHGDGDGECDDLYVNECDPASPALERLRLVY
jgi:hypothetical protein